MPKSNPTLTIDPNPVPLGTTKLTFSGTGYRPGEHLQILTGSLSAWTTTDDDGNFSVGWEHEFTVPETAKMQVWSTGKRGAVLAEASYTVE